MLGANPKLRLKWLFLVLDGSLFCYPQACLNYCGFFSEFVIYAYHILLLEYSLWLTFL